MVTAGLFITLASLIVASIATLAAIYLGCWCMWYAVNSVTKRKR